jgi:hypothetical protein
MFIDPKTFSKIICINGDVSEGSENDLKMKELIGDDWKIKTGAEQPVHSYGCSPGYNHDDHWPKILHKVRSRNAMGDGVNVTNAKESGKTTTPVDAAEGGGGTNENMQS